MRGTRCTSVSASALAVPAARQAFEGCDAMLAVGTRFAEIATGSWGVKVPAALVHVDINAAVFDANYPAAQAIEGDARTVLAALLAELKRLGTARAVDTALRQRIAATKAGYRAQWLAHDTRGRVSPRASSWPCARRCPTMASPSSTTAITLTSLPSCSRCTRRAT